MADADDRELVRRAALDYFEGWFDGDPERMDRALHPELSKRFAGDLTPVTKEQMVEATRQGAGRRDAEREVEVEVAEVYGEIATAIVRSAPYREYLHLVRTPGGWRIANTLYVRT
ncbi:MAG TPA: nuclear transport factor 2 family protein [Gaiellaceae bacterium]|nr:nuclear transport factor 2 family protein [Gaiellaceae bacterium]